MRFANARCSVFLAASAAFGLVAPRSRAAEVDARDPRDPTAVRAVDVEGLAAAGPVAHGAGAMLQVAAGYRLTRSLSVGLLGSYTDLGAAGAGDSTSWSVWRAAAEMRVHALRNRWADLWLGGEVGVGVGSTHYENTGAEGGPIVSITERRYAPLLGVGAGAALSPLPFVSIGVETRAHLIAFGSSEYGQHGLTPAAYGGIVVGVHVPIGE